jgi:hypothetical protein
MASERDAYVFNRQEGDQPRTIGPRPANVQLQQVPIDDGSPPEARRNAAQRAAIARLRRAVSAAALHGDAADRGLGQLFGPSLGWAYRCYHVEAESNRDVAGLPLLQEHMYLFNVIVACEWRPSAASVALIERAMRRAADFLFDVTDGCMTIGQALVGGPELLNCADIQIMASNRLLPRSWIGGLHEQAKYMPIRVGRGMWQKNSRGSIPWDEPEGYRVLVHEWAHYALELLDDYADTHEVYTRGDAGTIGTNELRRSARRLVVPAVSQAVESIMASLEGTSELTAKRGDDPQRRKRAEWEALIAGFAGRNGRQTRRFPRITERPAPIEAPFPLRELPHVALLAPHGARPGEGEELVLPRSQLSPLLQPEHCWVYVLKGRDAHGAPERIVAQGTLDTRIGEGFPLLGAAVGDTLMLVGNGVDWRERVLLGEIGALADAAPRPDGRRPIGVRRWQDATPNPFPVIDVLPEPVDALDARTAPLRVRVSAQGAGGLESCPVERLLVFPLDQVNSPAGAGAARHDVTEGGATEQPVSLDGHVLALLPGGACAIATYAQGGGPPTGSPTGGTPLTPGSSDGNLLVFFEDQGEYPDNNEHHGALRVVTTRWPGGAAASLPGGGEARSYAYTLCSNGPLPLEYLPTLSLFYDRRAEIGDNEAVIHRQDDAGEWRPIASYRPSGAWYVAAPLDRDTAPRMVQPEPPGGGPRVERYRLFVLPRGGQR